MRLIFISIILISFLSLNAQHKSLSVNDSLYQEAVKSQNNNDIENTYYIFTLIVDNYLANAKFKETVVFIDSLTNNFPENQDSLFLNYSKILNQRAIGFAYQGMPKKTAKAFERQLKHLTSYDSDSTELAVSYKNTAQAFFNLHSAKGIKHIYKSIEISKAANDYDHMVRSYLTLANYLSSDGLSEMANQYLDLCEMLFKYHKLNDYNLLSDIYKRKGINFSMQKDYQKSFKWVEKAYQTVVNKGTVNAYTANTAGNVALEAKNIEDYKNAVKYAHLTIKHANDFYPQQSMMHSHAYLVLGEIYSLQEKNDSADYYLDKCISIYKNKVGPNYAYLSIPYHHKAQVFKNKNDYKNAALYYQKSIYANFRISDKIDSSLFKCPSLEKDYFSFDALKYAITEKSKILNKLYNETQDKKYLKATVYNIKKLDSLEWFFTNKKSASISENEIQFKEHTEVLNLISNIAVNNNEYNELAFQMLNNQKAGNLSASIFSKFNNSENTKTNELQNKIKSIEIDIIKLQKHYNKLKSEEVANKSKTLNRICDLSLDKISLKEELNKVASEYDEAISFKNIDIKKAVNACRINNASVIDYFYHENQLYIYLLNEDGLQLENIELTEDLDKLVLSFKRAVKTQSADKKEIGKRLSEVILMPVIDKLKSTKKLVIIPFKSLSDIPFDLLPVNKDGKAAVYDFAISYHYSAKLWLNSVSKQQPQDYNLLAIAPVFDKNNSISINEYTEFKTDTAENYEFAYRSGIMKPLPYSLVEIQNLQKTFNSNKIDNRILALSDAGLNEFKKYAPQSNIIHIATHGVSSSSNPFKTGLFFYVPDGDDKEDHFLSVYDLKSLNLNADLVVLSACKAGSGQLTTGEGLIALPRAFIHSGANNVLASYWLIHDERTEFLMNSFYSHLLSGNDYSESLRKAKIDCIENNYSELDWAGFFIIGR